LALGSSPQHTIAIDIELISCLLSCFHLKITWIFEDYQMQLTFAVFKRLSYRFVQLLCATFYWLIKNQEMHANNTRHGVADPHPEKSFSYVREGRIEYIPVL